NQRDLLNTLTDAGLIPNYAFPETGIELKSVLWRRKASDDHTPGAYLALPALRYERPASSALSEFAPENRFYANQRRVEIDQINMGLAKLEWWRLWPGCPHLEHLEVHGIARVTFRDVNFGELSKPGDTFSVADQSTVRPGFALCRHCGKVQTPQRPRAQNAPAQDHSFECAKRDSKDPADLVDCLYLYREF